MESIPDDWETWGIAARWDPRHGWHDPNEETKETVDAT
jgi:hypothetical protein